jgi:iron(III) transport system permease protein
MVSTVRELGASILPTGPNAKAITPAIVEAWFSISTELTAAMALLQTLAVDPRRCVLLEAERSSA